MSNPSPVERLVEAGLCDAKNLSDADRDRLNTLTDQEVQCLIGIHNKLGKAGSDLARPAFPV